LVWKRPSNNVFSGHDFLWSMLIPGAIALLLGAIGALMKNRAWIAPLALGLAFLTAFPAVKFGHWQMPHFPPDDSSGWLILVALLAMGLGILDALTRLPGWLRMLLVVISAAVGLVVLLKFKFRAAWTPLHGTMIVAAFSALAGICWAAIEDCADHAIIITPMTIWLIGSSVGVMSMMVGIDSYGKSALALAAASIAMLPAILWRRGPGSLRGGAIVFSLLLVTMLAGQQFLGSLSATLVVTIGSTPAFVWLGRFTPGRLKPWKRGAARLTLILIPLGTAVALAVAQFQRDQQNRDESGYYY
jgi:hypothetical protein